MASTAAGRGRSAINRSVPVLLFSLLFASAVPSLSWATLGDSVSSVASDSQTLEASARLDARATYTVHELQTPTGTVIREFVAPSGVVFAVAWRGPFKPSMALLLGKYFGDYAHAPRRPGSSRSRLIIEQPNLVVHAAGRMRSFAGIAFVPQLLPVNVAEVDLQ
jgi:hypothetical protein